MQLGFGAVKAFMIQYAAERYFDVIIGIIGTEDYKGGIKNITIYIRIFIGMIPTFPSKGRYECRFHKGGINSSVVFYKLFTCLNCFEADKKMFF